MMFTPNISPCFHLHFTFLLVFVWFCILEHIFGIWGCEHYDWDCVFSWLVLLVYSQKYFVSECYCSGSSEVIYTEKINPIPKSLFLFATHLLCQTLLPFFFFHLVGVYLGLHFEVCIWYLRVYKFYAWYLRVCIMHCLDLLKKQRWWFWRT